MVLVDDDQEALAKLERVLTGAAGWHFRAALTGGEALDIVTQTRPQIVIVKEDLPDLPGSMVVNTVKASAPDAVTLLYSPPGRSGRTGEIKLVDASREMSLVASYAEPGQLVGPLNEIREALRQKSKERRYLQSFRQRHFEFLQRYNGIKTRLKEELDRRKKAKFSVYDSVLDRVQHGDVGQVSVELGGVEAVADDEGVGRFEPHEVDARVG